MEEFDLLSKMERVEAPSGFEQKVMAQLSLRKRKHLRTRRRRRWLNSTKWRSQLF
jgi:hypothetical protein